MMMRKLLLLTGSILLVCFLLIIFRSFTLPKLKFEYICPDSSGYKPKFGGADFQESYFMQLRELCDLDKLVVDCKNDIEKILVVCNWVHHLWEHDSDNVPSASDPLSIVQEVMTNKKQFRCVEYSIVLAGCLNALGICSRVLGLKTSDVETREYGAGHRIVEAYIPSLSKWIMIDPQANVLPVSNGIPLHAVELQDALVGKGIQSYFGWQRVQLWSIDKEICDIKSDKHVYHAVSSKYFKEYINFIGQYLYYFDTVLDNSNFEVGVSNDASKVMLVPLGAKFPTVFQGKYPINNMHYTHSVACFYPDPC